MHKKVFLVLSLLVLASMLLVACQPQVSQPIATPPAPAEAQPTEAPPPTEEPAAPTEAPAATEPPAATEAPTEAPTEGPTPTLTLYPTAAPMAGRTQVRWYIGLGTGTDPVQLEAEQKVVDDFNASQDKIQLIMEVIPYNSAKDTLATEIASGNGPDIVGPVGWGGSNAFYGQWLDLTQLMKDNNFDTSVFDPALVTMYQTEEGQVGLPFAVFPSAIFFNTKLFDEAGLAYPPANYGEKYTMPDGTEVEWNWETLTTVARMLTVDANGKNATEEGFDKNSIQQYGFTWNFENHPNYWGAFWQAGSMLVDPAAGKGNFKAAIPEVWKEAWKWTYDGIWGDKPFTHNSAVEQSADFGSGNAFNSDKIAMTDSPAWYTCCVGNVKAWDFAAMPSYDGKVGGRIDADTFRILKDTKHPQEAFEVLQYLIGAEGTKILLIGSEELPPAYGGVPARTADQQPFIDAKAKQFPWVENLATLMAGLSYPDAPSAEGWMPNWSEAWNRIQTLGSLYSTTAGLDLAKEEETLVNDLDVIFNK
jgi:multiple sugar transport system substrate-binding protein